MVQIEKMQIQAEGEENVLFLVGSTTLGLLDMIEKGIISNTDAAMAFCLPIMIRTEEPTLIHQICSRIDELDTYPLTRRQMEIEKIRKLCFELMADYNYEDTVRKKQKISIQFLYSGSVPPIQS